MCMHRVLLSHPAADPHALQAAAFPVHCWRALRRASRQCPQDDEKPNQGEAGGSSEAMAVPGRCEEGVQWGAEFNVLESQSFA